MAAVIYGLKISDGASSFKSLPVLVGLGGTPWEVDGQLYCAMFGNKVQTLQTCLFTSPIAQNFPKTVRECHRQLGGEGIKGKQAQSTPPTPPCVHEAKFQSNNNTD